MAIYHFSGTVISRSQGRSAVACAAYRSGEKLFDERYEKTQDFSRKQDVVHKEILLPKDAPVWMGNREKLWNGVEACERRKDAQLAREFNFALPKELNFEQNLALARDFVQTEFVDRGMVADMCIHLDINKQGEQLPHVHVMLTMREITDEGFGQKERAWNDKALLVHWREAWAEAANKHLALNDIEQRIDHRTLEAQGIHLEPQYKIGPVEAKTRLARVAEHERIARENGERLLKNPEIALHALTQQQSTFSHHDMARFVNRHSVDQEQFQQVYDKLKSCEALVRLGVDPQGRERFTSLEMVSLEQQMLAQAGALASRYQHPLSERGRLAANTEPLSPKQQAAFEFITQSYGLSCVIGYAGSGKSTLLGAAREAWEGSGYRVHGVTLSGIAAEGLQGASGIESRTFASRSYYWNQGEQKLSSRDILVVDEAGMLGSKQMARLMEEVSKGGAKVVLIGDPQQLQAIEAGGAFRAIVERSPFVELTDIYRQKASWQQEATREFAQNQVEAALNRYAMYDHLHPFQTETAAKTGLIELWNDARLSEPRQTRIILAYTRADVKDLNEMARECRVALGELGPTHLVQTERGERAFAIGERLYFLKNDRSLGVKNGTLGTLAQVEGESCAIRLDSDKGEPGRLVTVNLSEYNHLEYGYAATIHKAQGVTVDRTYLLGSQYVDAHSAYVAMSRHRESVDVCYSRELFPTHQDLVDAFARARPKDVSLDYLRADKAPSEDKSMDAFVRQFEAEHPERAEALQARLDGEETSAMRQAKEDLSDFVARFEAEYPERAKALEALLYPEYQEMAERLSEGFSLLERGELGVEQREDLRGLTQEALEDERVMAFLENHHEALFDKINDAHKAHEPQPTPEKELDKSDGFEIDF